MGGEGQDNRGEKRKRVRYWSLGKEVHVQNKKFREKKKRDEGKNIEKAGGRKA